MPFDIATGTYTDADPVLPLLTSGSGIDATAGVTPTTPVASGPSDSGPLVTGERDLTGERLSALAPAEADCRDAQTSAIAAEDDRRGHYQGQALPLGGSIGDAVDLPLVPDAATPPAMSDLYPYAGQEPAPAAVGFFHGDEPTLPE